MEEDYGQSASVDEVGTSRAFGVDKKMVTKWERSGMPVHTRGRRVASQFRLREVRAWLKVREAKAKAAEKAKVRESQSGREGEEDSEAIRRGGDEMRQV